MTFRALSCRFRSRLGNRRTLPALIAVVALFTAACDSTRPAAPHADALGVLSATSSVELLVGFTTAPGEEEIALIRSLGGTVLHQFRHIPVLEVRLPSAVRETLATQPGVAYVEDVHALVPLSPDPMRGKQVGDWGIYTVDAPGAWELGFRGQGVKVGIFDSGIALDHPDLKVVGGVDLIRYDGEGLNDCQGHGTHVAGIVAALDNGHHSVGVAPRAELYSMRFADCDWAGATNARMIEGVEWAIDEGMQVVNMSFGYAVPVNTSFAVEAIFEKAYEAGIVLVGASGNDGIPAVGYPAAFPTVIAVGATDDGDNLSSFSQYGVDQELTAPGVNNLAAYLMGEGQHTAFVVDSDGGRELSAVALEYAGKTGRRGITAQVVDAGFGTLVEFGAVDCEGRIALITRGVGTFALLAENAMDAGCAAAIIHNNQPGTYNGTLGEPTAPDGRPWIPVVAMTLDDGLYLKEQIEAGETAATLHNTDGNLAILSGTSMAAPHVAGVAALVLQKNPNLTPDEVRQILRDSADDLGVPGWDPQFGHGRVNARRAIELTP